MKRLLTILLCTMLLFSNGVIGSSETVVAADSTEISQLVLSENEVSMETGDSNSLTATAIYVDGKSENVTIKTTWSSSNSDIASVYAGTIRGIKEGKATIVATYLNKTVPVQVDVSKKIRTLTKNKQTVTIRTGEVHSEQVNVSAVYEDGSTEDVTTKAMWTVEDQSVATVFDGKIVGQSSGSTTVTAKFGKHSVSIPVNVEIIKRLEPSKSNVSLLLRSGKNTETIELQAIFPDGSKEEVSSKAVWSSDNESVADVINGTIKAYGVGEATISAKYGTKTATIKVDVDSAMVIELDQQDVFMLLKDSPKKLKLTASFINGEEEDITDRAEWTTSNKAVATVNKGTIVAHSSGEAIITAKYGDNEVKAAVDVEVPRRLEVDQDYVSLSTKDSDETSVELIAYYANDTHQSVTEKATWTSSNENVATVYKGKIKALKSGEATITAKYADKTVTVGVDVDYSQQIVVDVKSLNLQVGGSQQLVLKAIYEGREEIITDKAEWSSSAEAIAEVRRGNVTGLKDGSATISAKYGNRTTTIPVSVGVVKKITIKKADAAIDKLVMQKDNSVQLTLNAEYMDGSTKDVTDLANWSPESSTIAQVDANGMVKAKGSGKVDISASFGNKTVKIPVEVDITASLTSNTKNVFMSVGEKVQIKLNPDAADSNYITDQAEWSSSSSKVAEVTKGEIRAYSNGKTTITARYGGKSVSILVEVDVLQGLVANTRLVRLKTLGDVKDIQTKVTLMATLTGGRTVDMTDQAEWKVSSYKVAEANKGTIKAIGYGKTTVTARYGGKSVTVYVEVDQLKYLKTNHVQLNMKVGETKQVNATATYLDGIDRDVTKPALWTTPKVTIADVKDGIIKATGVGRTVITVSYGDKKTQVIVNVTK
ncbi:Ig-like domain-containing protein [Brevibacillus laterosporus]|uniref:Ig-like domain-containing protein n=1 Tax=Brevibacillus laterosporus TaxID=1465 RepID=UPI0014448D3B|nr:Ig-like domain-containing protein [Brevibacillus laterosporus]NKQ18702.1 hypothetical protein [Brevibacillus laterosporus]WNX33468.1 Ig-like domain-containing protein [Brevibacillus laterosporus]